MGLSAIILSATPLNPYNIDTLNFSVPMDNGIRILSPDYCTLDLRYPYYGDTVNLKFWKLLKLPFGSAWSPPSVPLTRQDGYKYIYNHTKREFDAYDKSGVNIVHITGITSIADMNIDFTIFNSHQFEIFVEVDDLGKSPFIFTPHLVKKRLVSVEQKDIIGGMQNNYLLDNIDIKTGFEIQYISGIDTNVYNKSVKYYHKQVEAVVYKGNGYGTLGYFWDMDWSKNLPSNDVYVPTDVVPINPDDDTDRKMFANLLTFDILLPFFATTLYPDLMPVIKDGETQNNRPIYEPWLIWGFLKFLYNYRTSDFEDDFEIPIFDLSPRYL